MTGSLWVNLSFWLTAFFEVILANLHDLSVWSLSCTAYVFSSFQLIHKCVFEKFKEYSSRYWTFGNADEIGLNLFEFDNSRFLGEKENTFYIDLTDILSIKFFCRMQQLFFFPLYECNLFVFPILIQKQSKNTSCRSEQFRFYAISANQFAASLSLMKNKINNCFILIIPLQCVFMNEIHGEIVR